jgi:integrase
MLAEKNILSIKELNSVKAQEQKTLLISDIWTVVDKSNYQEDRYGNTITDEDGKPLYVSQELNLKDCYEGMPVEYELSVKLDLLNLYSHNGEIILAKPATFKGKLHNFRVIKNSMQRMGLRYFREINSDTIKQLCSEMIKPVDSLGNITKHGHKDGVIAYSTFAKSLSVLGSMTVNSILHGLLDYPPIHVIPYECINLVEDEVSEHTNLKTWLEGGTLGTLPLEIAIVMLSEALEYFETPDLKRLLAIVEAVSKHLNRTNASFISIRGTLRAFLDGDYGRDDKGVYVWAEKKHGPYKLRAASGAKNLAAIYFDLCDEFEVDYKFERSIKSLEELTLRIRHAFFRVSASLTILTGARISELFSLKNDAFEFSNERGKFKSKIRKTQNNSETYRPVTIHAEPIAWIANGLSKQSALHGENSVSPWLLKAVLPWIKQETAINGLSWEDLGGNGSMGGFYRELLGELISDYDPDEYAISSHRFRHTWAELAIRRFDGNVPEAIRNYFRHWYGSFMTMEYIRGKIKVDLPEINREYMREILHRIAQNEEEFFGPAAKYMLSLVKDVEVLDPETVNGILDEFDVIKVHEHSYCMMPKKFKTQAKCWDKETQTPNYDEARWDNCGGCSGRCTLGNAGSAHKDAILRIGMTAQEMIATNESLGLSSLNAFWKKQLKQAEFALKEMGDKIDIVDVTDAGGV